MEQRNIALKRGQVKSIYEYFVQLLQQEGKNAEFSYFVYKNAELLSADYKNIANTVYNEAADSQYHEFMTKNNELVAKYADRDEQGNLIVENNNYKITEQIVEFKEESNKLQEEYAEMLTARRQKIDESMQFLNITNEYNLYVLPINKFPDNTIPAIVGIFGI